MSHMSMTLCHFGAASKEINLDAVAAKETSSISLEAAW